MEHKLNTNKSGIALALAGTLWILTAFSPHSAEIPHNMHDAGAEIFEIIIFLLTAMTLVEILVHYQFFDIIRNKIAQYRMSDRQQFYVVSLLTFFLSAALDNLTITIVMIQIARKFFRDQALLVVVAGIVVIANAGGAWSPIGDVTTIMLWLADKFSAAQIISRGILPSLALGITATLMMGRQLSSRKPKEAPKQAERLRLTQSEKVVIGTALGSFSLPLMMSFIGLPPYLGLLLGLGSTWLIIEFLRARSSQTTHLEANIDHLLQKTDLTSIKFFVGILLSVSALKTLGVLEILSHSLFGADPSFWRVFGSNVLMGLFSAIFDNVPLTALAIDILHVSDFRLWVLTALAVGTGGSTLVIGSVAGVIAMGMVKELSFGKYLKIASIPALVGYVIAMGVWLIQYNVLNYFATTL